MNELADILTGKAPKASAPAKTYDPFDAAVRTVIAEESDPKAQEWVAGVIANRAKKSGKNFYEVVTEKGQFEPWARGTAQAVDPNSPTYKQTAERVRDILEGKRDPSGGMTHFYAPEAQADAAKTDGRPVKPDFDNGRGVRVGSTLFFRAGDDGLGGVGALEPVVSEDDAITAFERKFGKLASQQGSPVDLTTYRQKPQFEADASKFTAAQKKTYKMMNDAGAYNPEAPFGSPRNPLFPTVDNPPINTPKGGFYVDPETGKLTRAPGDEPESNVGAGVAQGFVGDIGTSIAGLFPGHESSQLYNMGKFAQAEHDARYGGDFATGLGRFAGQVAPATIAMIGTEGAAAPALTRSGLGRFILGEAGTNMAPGAARLALRGASLGTQGAIEGAGGSLLTSSVSDDPVLDQAIKGAILGGVLRPAAAGTRAGVARLTGGKPLAGAAPIMEQQELQDMAQGLPVAVPLDKGQLTGAPGVQSEISAIRSGVKGDPAARVVQDVRADQRAALQGNTEAIANLIAGKPATPGAGAAAASDVLNTTRDAAHKAINDAYDAARARGEDAMLATAKDLREGTLEGLRREYDLDRIKPVASEIERFGEKGAPTVREIFDTRSRLSNLTQSGDGVEATAAKKAVRSLDAYMDKALTHDLLLGDPKAVEAWKEAIGKRAEFGRMFEGDDLIEGLTERVNRGGGRTLAVDPEEAANYIFNRSALGWVGKKNLGRDLKRLQSVLPEETWNGLRAEAFMRLAKAGDSIEPGTGAKAFSGQNFLKAWEKAKTDDPHVVSVLFTPEERKVIDNFAKVSQIATTVVKGGDNSSESTFMLAKLFRNFLSSVSIGGGAAGGGVAGGPVGAAIGALFGATMREAQDLMAVGKARKLTYRAKPVAPPSLKNPLIPGPLLPVAAAVTAQDAVAQPQERRPE